MHISYFKISGVWREIANAARTTIGQNEGVNEPTSSWKKRMLLAEHSPIRKLLIGWKWRNLPYWVSVHFVRHKYGIEHWVSTQRTDRTQVDRSNLYQDNNVTHEAEANAQAIINISRKRLCLQASTETRQAWSLLLSEIQIVEPELFNVCVPECIYRGWCYEYESCNYHTSNKYKEALNKYRQNINNWKGGEV